MNLSKYEDPFQQLPMFLLWILTPDQQARARYQFEQKLLVPYLQKKGKNEEELWKDFEKYLMRTDLLQAMYAPYGEEPLILNRLGYEMAKTDRLLRNDFDELCDPEDDDFEERKEQIEQKSLIKKACRFFERAATKGNIVAELNFNLITNRPAENKQAAEDGNPYAMSRYGEWLMSDGLDDNKGFYWLKKGAETNLFYCIRLLANANQKRMVSDQREFVEQMKTRMSEHGDSHKTDEALESDEGILFQGPERHPWNLTHQSLGNQ